MLDCIEKSASIGAIGPIQFKKSRGHFKLNFTWSYWNQSALRLFLLYRIKKKVSETEPILVSYLNAGCLLIKSQAFREIGMCNERNFMYGEEPHLFLKLKEHGYFCYLIPSIHVIHLRERSVRTLNWRSKILLKLSAIKNIFHALICGYYRIIKKIELT